MSYQRAIMNCKRCYELANVPYIDSKDAKLYSDSLWQAKNEAMKSLESCIVPLHMGDSLKLGANQAMQSNALVTKATTVCQNCDYKKARIVEILTKGKV